MADTAVRELRASLSALSEVLGGLGDDDDIDDDGRLDPGLVAVLEQITGAPDACLEFASLHRRVHDRMLTWEQFWADPGAQPKGILLFGEVMRASVAIAEPVLRQVQQAASEQDDPADRRDRRSTGPQV